MIAGIITASATLALVNLFGKIGRQFLTSDLKMRAQTEVGLGIEAMKLILNHANQLDAADGDSVQFRMDSRFLPGYDRNALSARGIPTWEDPDDDDDEWTPPASATDSTHGNDLDDDDDDNDGQLDVQCRFRLDGTDMVREWNFNEGGWDRRDVVAKSVTSLGFTYWGSKTNPNDVGNVIDLGDDGVAGTSDNGENDKKISSREIDWVLPAQGGVGNRSGDLDTPVERFLIVLITVAIACDMNTDGKNDFSFDYDVSPPLLPLKARRTGA
jgi:hypothetical protein